MKCLTSWRHRRKRTSCDCCGSGIFPRELYSRTAFILDGQAVSYNICETCQEIIFTDWYWLDELSIEDIFSEVDAILEKRHHEQVMADMADSAYERLMFDRGEARALNNAEREIS